MDKDIQKAIAKAAQKVIDKSIEKTIEDLHRWSMLRMSYPNLEFTEYLEIKEAEKDYLKHVSKHNSAYLNLIPYQSNDLRLKYIKSLKLKGLQ